MVTAYHSRVPRPGLRRVLAECKYPRLYSPECVEEAFSEVPSQLAKSSEKEFKKDAHPLEIHREFIGLCFSDGSRAHPCVRCEKGNLAVKGGKIIVYLLC
jgi:hypothetical protein